MKAEYLTRQFDLIPLQALGTPVTIIGAGAIGSWVALSLAKMGLGNITVWDDDLVSEENMNCQFYLPTDIGMQKVRALQELVGVFTGVEIDVSSDRFDNRPVNGILICAVDNMETRKAVWESQVRNGFLCKAFLDPRMGAENALMYVMNPNDPNDRESYAKTLYSDDEAEQERCTAKATIYTANLLSGLVCKAVKDLITDGPYPRVTMWNIKENDQKCWGKK